LPIEEQERVIGREKLSDVELPDDVKPANLHVALTTIVDNDGEEQQIVRFNMPFGKIGAREFGTYFIGYARTPAVIERMLANMFVGDPPGNHDRILDFSTAVTGNLFFVPSAGFIDDPPAASEQPVALETPLRPRRRAGRWTSGASGSERGRRRDRRCDRGVAASERVSR
jgi:putative iron-dependent peroxidase